MNTLLPARYNVLPNYNLQTPKEFISSIKDQGEDGVCWAFSSVGVLESSLLKQNSLTRYAINIEEDVLKNKVVETKYYKSLYNDKYYIFDRNGSQNFPVDKRQFDKVNEFLKGRN